MASVLTVKIHSPKDPSQMWIINHTDFNPAIHTLWAAEGMPVVEESVTGPGAEPEPVTDEPHTHVMPSVPDYTHDDDGNIVAVNIIDPQRRTTRKEIPIGEFDPDQHQLWSEHPRFH